MSVVLIKDDDDDLSVKTSELLKTSSVSLTIYAKHNVTSN